MTHRPFSSRASVGWMAVGLVAVALAACDVPDPLAPNNPYDSFGGPEGRTVTGPVDLRVTETTPTSIRIEWTDRSSFEAGFEILESYGYSYNLVDSVRAALPPDATSFTWDGLTRTADRNLRVVAVAVDGARSTPTRTVQFRYPHEVLEDAVPTSRLHRSVLSRDGSVLFDQLGGVIVYAVGDPAGRRLYRVSGIKQELHPVGENEALVVSPVSDDQYAAVVVRRLTPDGPGSPVVLEGATQNCRNISLPSVASSSGNRLAANCKLDGQGQIVFWDTTTGGLVGQFSRDAGSDLGQVIALSEDGRLALVWREREGSVVKRVSDGLVVLDATNFAGRELQGRFVGDHLVLVREPLWNAEEGVPTVRVYDLATGTRVQDGHVGGRREIYDVQDGRIVLSGDEGPRVVSFPGLDLERHVALSRYERIVSLRLVEDGLMYIRPEGDLVRWDFTRSWEEVPPEG